MVGEELYRLRGFQIMCVVLESDLYHLHDGITVTAFHRTALATVFLSKHFFLIFSKVKKNNNCQIVLLIKKKP